MLDLGTSFLASVARDPNALAIVDGDTPPHLPAMVRAHLGAGGGLRRAGAGGRRPSRHAAAEPLGGRDRPLGLPVRRHHRDADQLARHRRRARLCAGRRRGQGAGLRGGVGPRGGVLQGGAAPSAHLGRRAGRHSLHLAGQRARARHRAARRRRGLVGDALYVRHHRQAEGRAAPPARRARGGAGPRRAEPLPQRRADARRDAALPHHGGALAASPCR